MQKLIGSDAVSEQNVRMSRRSAHQSTTPSRLRSGGGALAIPYFEAEHLDLIITGEGPEGETPEYVRDAPRPWPQWRIRDEIFRRRDAAPSPRPSHGISGRSAALPPDAYGEAHSRGKTLPGLSNAFGSKLAFSALWAASSWGSN